METRYTFGGDEYLFADLDIDMSLEINFKVLAVCQEIERQKIVGIIEVCPANSSYLIHYRPEELAPQNLVAILKDVERKASELKALSSRLVDIPVLYDDPWTKKCAAQFADRHQDPSVTNLEYITKINGLATVKEFIAAHSGKPFWISMIGFVPGTAWGYQMVEREHALQAPKYVSPRTDTPERTVSHGGVFMAIYPVRGPGGYQLLGITPVPVYDPMRRLPDLADRYILAKAGDRWKLRPIEMDEFESIRKDVEAGTYRYRILEQEFEPARYSRDREKYLEALQRQAKQ
jgi:urea carboxylase